jgi:nucleoside-diphosphate-sugar epimerase
MKVLVTGGNGYVGSALLRSLCTRGGAGVRAVVRTIAADPLAGCDYVVIDDLAQDRDVAGLAQGCDVVVHTAARVHMVNDTQADSQAAYRRTNVEATCKLAREAARCGARRFVFVSSVKVNGESTQPGRPFREDDPPAPQGAYARSKWEAEEGLREICAATGMQYVIVRPPLVYGPGARANFRSLAMAIGKGLPLPLASLRNTRSLVALDNLVDFLCVAMEHSAAANETFLVSDSHDLSTPDLVRAMANALGRRARLVPFAPGLLSMLGFLARKQDAVRRLQDNLQVDATKAGRLLGWKPPLSVEEGMHRAMQPLRVPSGP